MYASNWIMKTGLALALLLALSGCTTQQNCKDEGGVWVVVAVRAEHRCEVKGGYSYTIKPCRYTEVKGCRIPQTEKPPIVREKQDLFSILSET